MKKAARKMRALERFNLKIVYVKINLLLQNVSLNINSNSFKSHGKKCNENEDNSNDLLNIKNSSSQSLN